MQITSNRNHFQGPKTLGGPQGGPPEPGGPEDKKELEVKPELENVADRYNASRTTGNYMAGMLLGAAKETVTTAFQAPRLAWEITENLWQADTVGPNLKILGTLAAIPAAALSLPLGPFYGAYQGVRTVADSKRERDALITKDAAPDFANTSFTAKLEANEARTMTGGFINSLEELGAAKLAEGEKPYDIPLLTPIFSVVGGMASFAISGIVGLAAGVVAGTITTGREMKGAFTDEGKTTGQRIEKFVAAPLNMLVMGPALAWNSIKEATPRGFVDGWEHGPVKPVVDTAKISGKLAASTIKEAWGK